jgi:hypothetical protein
VWRARRFAGKNLFPKKFLKWSAFSAEIQGKMESTFTAAPRETFSPAPTLNLPAAAVRAETVASAGKLPLEMLASTPFADTDFRRKIGIERWGWGLND